MKNTTLANSRGRPSHLIAFTLPWRIRTNETFSGHLPYLKTPKMKPTTDQTRALDNQKQPFLADGMIIVLFLALANFLLHLYFNNRYGFFRDEFDYAACGDHLAWGYVDHPPLIPFLLKIFRLLLGDSMRSIRMVPALATSAAVILTAMIARELGGRRFAMVLSALGFIAVPFYLNDGSVMTTNCLEPLLWMGCVYFAILAIKRDNPRYWLWFGVVAGIGAATWCFLPGRFSANRCSSSSRSLRLPGSPACSRFFFLRG